MEEIVKTFSSVFFMLLVTFMGASLVSASVDARNAQAYMTEAVSEISSANCSSSVVSHYENHAKDVDESYKFKVTNKTKSSSSEKYYATATLTYDYSLPILGISQEKKLVTQIR